MSWKKLARMGLFVIFALLILALQANASSAAKAPLAPAGGTPTPTGQEITNTPDPGATRIPPGPRPIPGGPGNLGSVMLIGLLIMGGLTLLVTASWYLPHLNRRKR